MKGSIFTYRIIDHTSNKEVLKDVVQVTVYNIGSEPFTVFGEEVLPSTNDESQPFIIPASGTYFDFYCKEIKFSGKTKSENKAKIFFNTLKKDC